MHLMRIYRTGDPGPAAPLRERHTDRPGVGQSAAYHAWFSARQRCTKTDHPQWAGYGGRGITMCERWLNSFDAFLADMGEPPPRLTLDRADNDGPYAPWNCRWASHSEQQKNKRTREFCLKGLHLMDDANTQVNSRTGKRKCRQCQYDGKVRRGEIKGTGRSPAREDPAA
jgi:hypothetical protein